jgi:hypothetical protein
MAKKLKALTGGKKNGTSKRGQVSTWGSAVMWTDLINRVVEYEEGAHKGLQGVVHGVYVDEKGFPQLIVALLYSDKFAATHPAGRMSLFPVNAVSLTDKVAKPKYGA